MRVKSVISRMGKKISLAMLAIVCGAAIGAGAWSLKSAQSAVSVSAEEGANTKFNAMNDLFTCTNVTPTVATIGDNMGISFKLGGADDVQTRKAVFKGIFTDDLNLEYLIQNSTTWVVGVKFIVRNTDGTELFTITKDMVHGNDVSLDWNNAISVSAPGSEETIVTYGSSVNARPYMNTEVAGNIAIEWAESGAIVSFTKDTSKTILANFNGESTYGSGETAVTLPKIMLPENGYVLEMSQRATWQPATVVLTKINGISVVDGEVNMKSLFTKGAVISSVNDISGYQLNGNTSAAWNNSLAQVFTGDFNLEYVIGTQNTSAGGFKIIFESLDGAELFTLKKYQNWNDEANQNWNNSIAVSIGEKTYKSSANARPYINSTQVGNIMVTQTESGIQIGYSGDAEQKILATFDGNNDMPEIHLPEQGYSVRFESVKGVQSYGMPPLITKINGEICTGVVEDKAADFSVDISAAGESVNESGVAALNLKRGANPFAATVKNAKFAGITLNEYTKSVDISSLDLSADKTAEISYLGVTKEYAVNVYDYVVTLKDGEAETKQYLEATETVTFVAGAQSDKIFIGYANGSSLYGVNSAYTPTEDIIFNAAYIDFAMHTGASVRKQTDENNQYGMRFLAGIAETDLETYGTFITETGVLILPEDLRNNKEITLANFSAENKEILKIANEGNEFAKGVNVTNFEGYGVYTGVITSILPANINRKFSARGYAVIKYSDNTTAIIYTAFGVENNSRSAYEVAKLAKAAGETGAALDYYISAVDGNN